MNVKIFDQGINRTSYSDVDITSSTSHPKLSNKNSFEATNTPYPDLPFPPPVTAKNESCKDSELDALSRRVTALEASDASGAWHTWP